MVDYKVSDLRGPLEGAARLIRSLGTAIPDRGDLPDLALLSGLQDEIDRALQVAVDALRADGHSWSAIGAGLGMTRGAACSRFGHR